MPGSRRSVLITSLFSIPPHLPFTSVQLQAKLSRPLILDIVAASATAAGAAAAAGGNAARGGRPSGSAVPDLGPAGGGSGVLAGRSPFTAAQAGLASLGGGSSAGPLYRARVAAKRRYLASAEGLPIAAGHAVEAAEPASPHGGSGSTARCSRAAAEAAAGCSVGPPLGLRSAIAATLAAASRASADPSGSSSKSTTCSSAACLHDALEALSEELCLRMHQRWLAYAWDMLSSAASAAAATSAAAGGGTGGAGGTGSSSGAGSAFVDRAGGKPGQGQVFTLSSMRDDAAKGRRVKLSPWKPGSGGLSEGAAANAGAAPPAASVLACTATPAFLASLDWHFAEVVVARCPGSASASVSGCNDTSAADGKAAAMPFLSSSPAGRRGFIVYYSEANVAMLCFDHLAPAAAVASAPASAPAASSHTCAKGQLIYVPRTGSVFAALLPDRPPLPLTDSSAGAIAGASAAAAAGGKVAAKGAAPAGSRGAGRPNKGFKSSLLVELWGSALAARSRAALLRRSR